MALCTAFEYHASSLPALYWIARDSLFDEFHAWYSNSMHEISIYLSLATTGLAIRRNLRMLFESYAWYWPAVHGIGYPLVRHSTYFFCFCPRQKKILSHTAKPVVQCHISGTGLLDAKADDHLKAPLSYQGNRNIIYFTLTFHHTL